MYFVIIMLITVAFHTIRICNQNKRTVIVQRSKGWKN